MLKHKGVDMVALCGFCLEYCVADTAISLSAAGVRDVIVLTDLTAAIKDSGQDEVRRRLESHRVRCCTLEELARERAEKTSS